MSQQCVKFYERNRGKQCTSNRLTFLLHHAKVPKEKVSKSLIDAVLKVGDRVHTALTSAIGHPGEKLSLDELQAASNFPFVTLEEALHSALQANAGSLLRILEYTVAVKKLPDGCVALFDPHGCAITMVFPTLEAVADYIRRFVRHKGCGERAPVLEDNMLLAERSFEVLPISSDEGVDGILLRLLKRTNQTKNFTR